MNTDEAKKVLPIIQALAEGKPIQYLMWTGGWADAESVNLNFLKENPERYRIKPEPRRFTLMVPTKEHPHYEAVRPIASPRMQREVRSDALYNEAFWEKVEVVEVVE